MMTAENGSSVVTNGHDTPPYHNSNPGGGGGGGRGDRYRKRPSLSCPDLSSDVVGALRHQHALAQSAISRSREEKLRNFQVRSFTEPDPETSTPGSSSPRSNRLKKFFSGMLRQSSLRLQRSASTTSSPDRNLSPDGCSASGKGLPGSPSGKGLPGSPSAKGVPGSPVPQDKKHTINTLLASAFSGLTDLVDEDGSKSHHKKLRRLHVINADGESPGSPGAAGVQATVDASHPGSPDARGSTPNSPRSAFPGEFSAKSRPQTWHQSLSQRRKRYRTSSTDSADLYRLNDRCLTCLDAAWESGQSVSPTATSTQNNAGAVPTGCRAQLCLDAIKNGRFLAHIRLSGLPVAGEVIARIDGYSVDFFWVDQVEDESPVQNTSESSHTGRTLFSRSQPRPAPPRPAGQPSQMYAGTVQLPLYIDVCGIQFTMESDLCVKMDARIKGMIEQTKKRHLVSSMSNHI